MSRWIVAGLVLALAACGADEGDEHEPGDPESAPSAEPRAPGPPAMTAADSAAALARIEAEREALNATFNSATALTAREVGNLRQDRNAEQTAHARRLGVRASGLEEIERLRRAGRIVPLGDSTQYWVLREMTHSVPFVTPDTHAMLTELGRRFHERLDSLGLPRFRMKITSALRTDELQASLRRTNPNASRTASAHEFGTTLDVSYERFAAPVPDDSSAASPWLGLRQAMQDSVAKGRTVELRAALGRAIIEMKREGSLVVMMENNQTVYHMTIARRFPAADAAR